MTLTPPRAPSPTRLLTHWKTRLTTTPTKTNFPLTVTDLANWSRLPATSTTEDLKAQYGATTWPPTPLKAERPARPAREIASTELGSQISSGGDF